MVFITHRYLTIILAPVILHGKNHIAVIIVLETINSICGRSACNRDLAFTAGSFTGACFFCSMVAYSSMVNLMTRVSERRGDNLW